MLRIRDVYPGSRIQIFIHPGSGSRIPDPGSRIPDLGSRIPDLGSRIQKHQLKNFLPKNLSLRSQKYGFRIRDPRSGIREKPIPDPGSRGQKGTGSRIRIRNTDKMLMVFTVGSYRVPVVYLPRIKYSAFMIYVCRLPKYR